MKNLIAFVLFVCLTTSIFAQNENDKTALLLIDIQDFYFPGGKSELVKPNEAAEQAAKILEHFRSLGSEVIHIKHIAKSQGDIHKSVSPLQSEKVITKSEVSCFNKTDLLKYLKDKKIKNLVICGMMTHMCVEAAVRAGYDYGFKVTLIKDACATMDLTFDNQKIKAADVHNSTLATFKYYCEVKSTNQYLMYKNDSK